MNDEFGNVELSREQFRELLLTFIIGMHIRRHATDVEDERLFSAEELEHYLLSLAPGFAAEDLVERGEEDLIVSRVAEDFCHEAIDSHADDVFWERLGTELAERDFLEVLPPEEREIVRSMHIFPKGVEPYYEKYKKEIDDHGVDRLAVDESKEGEGL